MMAGSMQVLPFEELDDESTDVARVYSLEEQFTDETSADRMEVLLASKPGVRAFIPKRTLVDMGMNKRTMHSELWTQDVAKAFGKLLRVYSLDSELSVGAAGSENPLAAGGGAGQSAGTAGAAADELDVTVESPVAGGKQDEPGNDSDKDMTSAERRMARFRVRLAAASTMHITTRQVYDVEARRLPVVIFNFFLFVFMVVGIALSVRANRGFGPFYLGNILLLLAAVFGFFVSFCATKKLFFLELNTLVNTIALVGGILAWIAFLIQIRTRVDELCVTYSSCNPGETAPLIAGLLGTAMGVMTYVMLYSYGLRLAFEYMHVVRMEVEDGNAAQSPKTCLTRVVRFVGEYVLLSAPCLMNWHLDGVVKVLCGPCASCGVCVTRKSDRCCVTLSKQVKGECTCGYCVSTFCPTTRTSSGRQKTCVCAICGCCCTIFWGSIILCIAGSSVGCTIAEIYLELL